MLSFQFRRMSRERVGSRHVSVAAVIEAVNEFRRAYSPPCKGGVAAPSKNGPVPKRRGRGGRSRVTFRNAFLKHLRVSDHPVCGASVASRLFINAAATPPLEEGNAPRLNDSRIRSQTQNSTANPIVL